MALRHLNDRLEALEARFGLSGAGNGGSDIDARFAAAEAKRVEMLKQIHVDKVERAVAAHAEKQNEEPSDNLEPAGEDPARDCEKLASRLAWCKRIQRNEALKNDHGPNTISTRIQ
jgi:hypothetical protein